MADETVTGANETPAGPVTADALTSPVNDGFSRIDPSVDNVSDIDLMAGPAKGGDDKNADPAKAGDAKAADKATADKAAEKAAADKAAQEAAEKADLERFDKHPRFQELLKERDTFKAELAEIKGKLSVLTPQDKKNAETREDQKLPYIDITTKTKEELLEWQEDDPVGYAANLYQQMVHEAREELKAEEAQKSQKAEHTAIQEKIKGTFEGYEKENPDFRKMWDSGELKKFMDEHPGHNAISAHQILTSEARTKAAVDKAVKETEERITKNFQAKRNAQVIGEGGDLKTPDAIPDELKHTDKYGGRTTVLAGRLARMRQQAQGG